METINAIELREENIYPDEQVLTSVLGNAYPAYTGLLQLYDRIGLNYEWRYYHDGKAWLCKVQFKKRTIVWMSAWKEFMQATIYFPEKYLELVWDADISASQKEKIRNTKNVGKSKPCTFELRDESVLADIEKIIQLKLKCK